MINIDKPPVIAAACVGGIIGAWLGGVIGAFLGLVGGSIIGWLISKIPYLGE